MSHLRNSEIIDAIDGALPAERQAHAQECPRCREEVAEAAGTLRDVRSNGAPEPSPLFWEHFSTRVREAISQEPQLLARGSGLWRRPAQVGILLTLLIAALAYFYDGQPSAPRPVALTQEQSRESDLPESQEAEESSVFAEELADGIAWEDAEDIGLVGVPGAADGAVLQLTADQRAELVRLLEAELGRSES